MEGNNDGGNGTGNNELIVYPDDVAEWNVDDDDIMIIGTQGQKITYVLLISNVSLLIEFLVRCAYFVCCAFVRILVLSFSFFLFVFFFFILTIVSVFVLFIIEFLVMHFPIRPKRIPS